MRNRKKLSWRDYRAEILIFLVGVTLVNVVFIPKAFRQSHTVDPEGAAQLGSFVGGYFGALFALGGVILLVTTLKKQQSASAQQNFENKYFELIKMHRDNVQEIGLPNSSGRKVFVLLLREFRCALQVVREVAEEFNQELTQQEKLLIAYYCLFYGVGPNSSRMLKMSLSTFDTKFVDAVENLLNRPETKERFRKERKFQYPPFEGHQSRLGHYYRHLYQMVRYVDQQTFAIDKYEYVKTIRAQLSTHEQALLLLNSLTPVGENWWDKHLITRYKMVKNIPRDFFDAEKELDTSTLFKPGYFEWEEKR